MLEKVYLSVGLVPKRAMWTKQGMLCLSAPDLSIQFGPSVPCLVHVPLIAYKTIPGYTIFNDNGL